MSEVLLGTGVELRLPRRAFGESEDPPDVDERTNEVFVEAEVFAEFGEDGHRSRFGGIVRSGGAVSLSGDPTTSLLEFAHLARELDLGDLLGDLRIRGSDLTRFEFYAAPFHVDLAQDLRERLEGSWRGRAPG
jgi:hypothetical protein